MVLNMRLVLAAGCHVSVLGCATESVSTSRSLREMLDARMCSSWKPRQVP